MKHLYFIEIFHTNRTGFTTYKNELFAGLGRVRNICLNVITLASPTSELVCKKIGAVNQYYIPSIKNQPKEQIALILKQFVEDSRETFYFINYAPSYPTVKMLQEYFPQGKIIRVIHDFMWATFLLGDVNRLKRILFHQEKYPNSHLIESIYKDDYKSYHAVDKVVCLSEDTQQVLKEIYEVPHAKLSVIHNGLGDEANSVRPSYELRKKRKISPEEKILVYVGRVSRQKGIVDVLEVFHAILAEVPKCKLVIIGEIDRNILAAVERNFKENILITGVLPKQQVYEWYHIADVGLLPSYYEQCSYTCIEMKMFGLPIVASDGIGVRNMVDESNGIVARIGDKNDFKEYHENLVKAIVKALTLSSEEKDKLRKMSREDYFRRYTTTSMVEKYLAL